MFIPQEEYDKILSMMPILCVDLMILFNGKCLLLKRKNEPAKGQYWFPGGRICKMETIESAALRKAKEEVNLDCRFQEIVSIEETMFEKNENMASDIHTVNICCHLSTHNFNNLTIDESHNGYIWVNLEQAKNLNLHSAVFMPLLKCLEQIS